jgi:DNA polymerase-3 subunit alpha
MGFYVSGHPLEEFRAETRAFANLRLGDTAAVEPERDYSVVGIVTAVQRRTSRAGKPMAFVSIEDDSGQAEVVLFGQTYEKHATALVVDEVLLVRGRVEAGGALRMVAREVVPMWRVREQLVKSVVLALDADATEPAKLDELFELCRAHRGGARLYFEVSTTQLPKPVRLHARSAVIEPSAEMMAGLVRLFGREAVVLEGE